MNEPVLSDAAWRAACAEVAALLGGHLERATRGEGPVLRLREPEEELRRWPEEPGELPALPVARFVARLLEGSVAQHHPRYVGHQVNGPHPEAVLVDLAASLLNNGMAAWEAGPASSAIEHRAVRWLAAQLGFPEDHSGVFTSGGSLGNLTALLAARQARAGFDVWREGVQAGPPLAWLVGEQAHYSLDRAVRVLGAGAGGLEPVPSDAVFRLDPAALPGALARARARGRRVIGVVASAGSTATGAVDPLQEVADFCARHELWLHVDGAHGLSVALSPRHRELVRGVERADSLVWDAHKLLGVPALATLVLFRDGQAGYGAFAQEASYLFQGEGPRWWDIGLRTVECTKRGLALPVWALLLATGTRALGERIGSRIELCRWLARRLGEDRDFEVAHEPDLDILCFRFAPPGVPRERLSELQGAIRRRLLETGEAFLTEARLRGEVYLRAVVLNAWVSQESLEEVVALVRRLGGEVLAGG